MQEEEKSTTPPKTPNNDHQWIKEVARQSWEPELLISGAAAYASLSLPGLFKEAFTAYRIDLMIGSGDIDLYFPTLIYAVFASIAQILIMAFFVHFTMRAFWVGMVGLLSVYPEGIRFNEIKFVNSYGREYLKRKLSTVDEFVIRLDKWCSVLFSVAFVIVLAMLSIALMYAFFFLLVAVGKLLVPSAFIDAYEAFISTFLVAIVLVMLFITLGLKSIKNKEKSKKWSFLFNHHVGQVAFPVVSKVTPYLMYTFYSHLSRRRLTINMSLIGVLFMVLFFNNVMDGYQNNKLYETRSYFSKGSAENLLNQDYYENLRDKNRVIERITIQADIIKEPFLKLFIAYPKSLDIRLNKICKPLKLDKKLTVPQRIQKRDEHRLACFREFYQIYIDKELVQSPEFMFHVHPTHQVKGIIAYIPIDHLTSGSKNLLQIKTKIPDPLIKKRRRTVYAYSLPFWYVKEK